MLRTNYLLTKYFFMLLVLSVDFFLKKLLKFNFSKSSFRNTIMVSNSLAPWVLVRVFSDVLVAFLYFDICHNRQSNLVIETPEFSQPVVAGHFQ